MAALQFEVQVLVEGDVGVTVVEADADGLVDGDTDQGLACPRRFGPREADFTDQDFLPNQDNEIRLRDQGAR